MTNNEALLEVSEYEDEWYGFVLTCSKCGTEFMNSGETNVCPGCGRKIIGKKENNTIVYTLTKELMTEDEMLDMFLEDTGLPRDIISKYGRVKAICNDGTHQEYPLKKYGLYIEFTDRIQMFYQNDKYDLVESKNEN